MLTQNCITPLALALVLSGCIDDPLQRQCPAPTDCYTDEDGVVHTDFEDAPERAQYGTTFCKDSEEPPICRGERFVTPETCNGIDDDGDGRTDNITRAITHSEYGCDYANPCASRNVCRGGEWLCEPDPSRLTAEICDGEDNDCNGETDEGLDQPVFSYPYEEHPGTLGRGVCTAGVEYCSHGEWVVVPAVLPSEETCFDDRDNDCNGETDENLQPIEQSVTLVVDLSGSMLEELVAITTAVCTASQDAVADALTHVRLVEVASYEGTGEYPWINGPSEWGSLTDACLRLSVLPMGGGTEYMIEGGVMAAEGWETPGLRRQVFLTDEQIQIADAPLATLVAACASQSFTIDVVAAPGVAASWDAVAQACGGTTTILPTISTVTSLVEAFTSVLTEGC